MKKEDLKKFLKPIIKESIREMLFEEKFLSNIISECVKSVQPIIESKVQNNSKTQQILEVSNSRKPQNNEKMFKGGNFNRNFRNEELERDILEQNHQILSEFKGKTFNGVKIFENVEPLKEESGPIMQDNSGKSLSYEEYYGISKDDPGIDISALFG